MKTPRTQAGLKRLHRDFGVPTRPYELAPHMRDTDLSRGALANVPREPVAKVMDVGAPTEGPSLFSSTGSPASATFTAGRVTLRQREKETRRLPANQIVGSTKVTP